MSPCIKVATRKSLLLLVLRVPNAAWLTSLLLQFSEVRLLGQDAPRVGAKEEMLDIPLALGPHAFSLVPLPGH